MKKFIFLIFILVSQVAIAQDWNQWNFSFKFKINTNETIRYKYKNFELFLNDSYSYEMYQGAELKLDSLTKDYTLLINYGCISCGYANSAQPPEIYIKVNLEYYSYSPFSTIIPIYFQQSPSKSKKKKTTGNFDLGTIEIKHFLTDDLWKDTEKTFEVIEAISPGTKKYRKSGEYTPRRINRMIKVLVE